MIPKGKGLPAFADDATLNQIRSQIMTWADALRDAEAQLAAAQKRVRELTLAVRDCRKRVRAHEPFPGQELD